MRSFRTSIVVATAALALSWSGLSHAEDDVGKKKGTTTKSPSTGTNTGSSSDMTDTPGTPPSTAPATTPSTSTDTTTGSGTDSTYGTGYGSTYSTTPGVTDTTSQPYQQTPAPAQQTQTYSTTTTTAASYDDRASADRAGYMYRPNRPMLATGLGIFAGTYATSVIVGAQSDRDEDKRLYIPVVGPWLDLGQRECGTGGCDQTEDWNRALLIGSGILQGVGAGLSIASLFVPEERDRPMRAAEAKAKAAAAAKPAIRVLPVSMRGGGGLGAVGTF